MFVLGPFAIWGELPKEYQTMFENFYKNTGQQSEFQPIGQMTRNNFRLTALPLLINHLVRFQQKFDVNMSVNKMTIDLKNKLHEITYRHTEVQHTQIIL